ncbi:MAG: OadG family protein [Selenomonadaceae bacterium]|nr:OadG family protein [Selenomonadaceae bacterium]
MGHPVTTNPFIIMTINMTVVFIVLMALMVLIKAIHALDPTKEKEEPKQAAPAPVAVAPPPPVEQVKEEGIPGEVIAAIAAAVTACGYSAGEIRAIRPIERNGWKVSGRSFTNNRLA